VLCVRRCANKQGDKCSNTYSLSLHDNLLHVDDAYTEAFGVQTDVHNWNHLYNKLSPVAINCMMAGCQHAFTVIDLPVCPLHNNNNKDTIHALASMPSAPCLMEADTTPSATSMSTACQNRNKYCSSKFVISLLMCNK